MDSALLMPNPNPSGTSAERRLEKVILRLVKGGPERLAIEAGQIDAIVDPASGTALLLPEAQRAQIERTQAEAAMQERNRFARTTLDALAAHVAVLDASGVVLLANKAWRACAAARAGIGAGVPEGASYLAECDSAGGDERVDAIAIAAGIRQVIAGERELFRYEHACATASGRRWFRLGITGVPGGALARAVVSREDITERKRFESLLGLEYTVARCLADATNASSALKAVIRAVCESQGWDCGRYFRLDSAAGMLRFDESWGVPTPAVAQFLERSRGLVFLPGAGLSGRVCQSGQPLWILDGTQDAGVSPTALAPETGGDGAFVFPVMSEDHTIGVLAFSSRTVREPNDRMLQTVRSIGSKLGRFLERQQAADALRRSELRFRKLTEISSDWYWEQDQNFRFTQFVGCGVPGAGEVLGKTHWELPNIVLTEPEWAEHKSHLAARWSFCDFEFAVMLPDGKLGTYCISGEPVYDDAGTFTGYCGTGRDITRKTEGALRETEALLRAMAGVTSG